MFAGLWEGLLILSCQRSRDIASPWDGSSALGPTCSDMKALDQFNGAESYARKPKVVLQARESNFFPQYMGGSLSKYLINNW